MQNQTLSWIEKSGLYLNILLVYILAFGYVYLCFIAPEAMLLGYLFGTAISLVLFYHIGRLSTIFKQKKAIESIDYLVNFPLAIATLSSAAILFLLVSEMSSMATKLSWSSPFMAVIGFNVFLILSLEKKK